METGDSHKEQEILDQYTMRPLQTESVKAWSREYGVEEIMEDYLEKSGHPVSPHQRHFAPPQEAPKPEEPDQAAAEDAILAQYTMQEQENQSVKAWSKEYGIEDIMNDYLRKSGYPATPSRTTQPSTD